MAVVALFFFSCSSGSSVGDTSASASDPSKKPVPAYDNTLVKGSINDSIICQNQPDLSYALYLPTAYTAEKPFPCIYFFDAHARGALPVGSYKALAEKYGFVMIGYNNSKNGMNWQINNANIKKMMEDTRARINIDPKQVYTSGFSGGSRIAGSVAIEDGGVAGVVGCAAGLPSVENGIPEKFNYFGIVGDYDFNLTEMEQLDEALDHNGFSHQLLVASGIHGWPSISDFETAMLWLQVTAMKGSRQPKNETLINALKNDYESRIKAAKTSNDLLSEFRLLEGAVRALNGLTDVIELKNQITPLSNSLEYQNAVKSATELGDKEMKLQQELARQFTHMNEEWWAKKINEINNSIKEAGNNDDAKMYHRLLNYLGLVGYMQCSHALNAGDLSHTADYLKIFKLADPNNPDVDYLSAIYFMKTGFKVDALSKLSGAAEKGYSEVTTLLTEPAFVSLHEIPVFDKIVGIVMANAVAK